MQIDQSPTDQSEAHITNTTQPTSDELSNAVKSVINEEKERNRRKLNLIIHNIPESEAEAPTFVKRRIQNKLQMFLGSNLRLRLIFLVS